MAVFPDPALHPVLCSFSERLQWMWMTAYCQVGCKQHHSRTHANNGENVCTTHREHPAMGVL
jgi:hypothetical protein